MSKLDERLLLSVVLSVVIVVTINFITSYGHIYAESIRYGEYGVDARLMPIAIDGMLLALSVANVFAARFPRKADGSRRRTGLLRSALAFGVAGTVAANAAYGARWGLTGGLLSTWSPVALFITVESGLFMFRIVADMQAGAVKAATPRKPRVQPPPGKPRRAPVKPQGRPYGDAATGDRLPAIRGSVSVLDPFAGLKDAS